MSPLRVALATLIATFVLLLIGGTVNPTGSSLACPDWPLCHGEVFPDFVGGVQFEHSHRLAGAAVGLLSVLLLLVTWRTPGLAPSVRRLAALLVVLVIVQGGLGAITVLFKLVTLVSTAHLALSMGFFLLLITMTWWLWQASLAPVGSLEAAAPRREREPALPRVVTLVALVATFAQIVLGGFMRHTGAGRACGADFPTCGGEWWPELWAARVNMLHRAGGIVVAILVIACAVIAGRRAAAGGRRLALAMAFVAPFLVILQIVLGVLVVTSSIALPQILAHFAVAILLLAAWWLCFLDLGVRWRPAIAALPLPRGTISDYVALTKPGITRMAALAAVGALWMAPGRPSASLALAAIAGIVLIVAAANALNQHAERDTDAFMERTRLRPLPARRMEPANALIFGLVLVGLALPLLAFFVNLLTAGLGLLALVIYLGLYTPMKRRTPAALLVGAVPGAMPVLMGWTAATGQLDWSGLALFAILFIWQVPHFLAISVFRQAEYDAAGLRVVPSVRGLEATRRETLAYTVALLPVSLAPVLTGLAGLPYVVTACLAGAGLIVLSALAWKEGPTPEWAWRYFRGTLAYIPAMGIGLALDGWLR